MQSMQGGGDGRRAHRVCRATNTLRAHSTISIFKKQALRVGLAAGAAVSPIKVHLYWVGTGQGDAR